MPVGDCFEVAAHVVVSGELGDSVRLVHGLPLGQGKENLGRRYWHAWVEYEHPDTREIHVVDRHSDLDLDVPRNWYYALGHVETVYRYTGTAATKLLCDTGNYGPWVDGWEDLGL